jgi:hypothetical protein
LASGGVPCSSSCTIFSFHSSLPFFRLRACSAAGKSQGHEPVVPSTRPPSVGWGSRAEARQPKPRKIDSSFEQEGSEVTEIPSPLAPFAPVKPICISDVRWSVSTFGSFRCAALAGKPSASTPYRGKGRTKLQGIWWEVEWWSGGVLKVPNLGKAGYRPSASRLAPAAAGLRPAPRDVRANLINHARPCEN